MYLLELIADNSDVKINNKEKAKTLNITGLTCDSRDMRTGFLFGAFPGVSTDGRNFIDAAIEKGAVALLVPTGTVVENKDVVILETDNPRQVFAKLAGNFFGRQVENTVAVTGTNGKSSTVNFCRQIWQTMEHAAASLGTIGIMSPHIQKSSKLTTPDPVTLHAEIAELEASGVIHLALEASSQGLDQYRLDGLHIQAAGFLNLTRDHLDYHGTMEEYLKAKLRLFTEILPETGIAVLNKDMDCFDAVNAVCQKRGIRVIEFGKNAKHIRLANHKALIDGQFLELIIFDERYELELPLVGEFQAYNALCALGLVIAKDPDNIALHMQAVHALEKLKSVRGRLELAAKHPNGASIYVDYAHTPDGLETMLKAIRPHTHKKLHVLVGCGGDRDRGKRPMMAKVAVQFADDVIITDDNPRTEDPDFIRREMMAAAPTATEIAGRRKAIQTAIQNLEADDVLILAGKGHEQGQLIGTEMHPFDDVEEACKAVSEIKK